MTKRLLMWVAGWARHSLYQGRSTIRGILTSNVCSIPEVVGDAGVLVDPFEVGAIADGIKRLTHDSSLQEELRRKGLLRAKKFSWEETARRTWGVLQMAGARDLEGRIASECAGS